MSKNFELLQQITKEEVLYDTAGEWTNAEALDSAEASIPANEERQKVLQNSSLPDVFKIS